MPLTQPGRHNPLMRRYFQEIGLPGARLARRCGVSHSQVYMARKRNVGADNAEKISRGVASILGLSEEERLRLKAETMGHPGELVRAYLGDSRKTARLLDVPESTATEILDEERSITHKSGIRALGKLKKMGAPAFVIESVDLRLMPPPEPRRGFIAHDLHGPELGQRYVQTKASLGAGKPKTHEAIQKSGLMPLALSSPERRRAPQRVEKVGTELIATTNRARNVPKSVYLVPDLERKRVPREFFNTLGCSTNFARDVFSELRAEGVLGSPSGPDPMPRGMFSLLMCRVHIHAESNPPTRRHLYSA